MFQQFYLDHFCLIFIFFNQEFVIGSLTKHQTEERNIGTEEVEVNKPMFLKKKN